MVTVTAKTEIPPPPHPYEGNSNALFATVTNAALTAHGAALFWGSGHRDPVLAARRVKYQTSQNQRLGNQSSSRAVHRSTADDRRLGEAVIRS